jgi:hypothetical protein
VTPVRHNKLFVQVETPYSLDMQYCLTSTSGELYFDVSERYIRNEDPVPNFCL